MLLLVSSREVFLQLTMWKSQALQRIFKGVNVAFGSKQRPHTPTVQCL